MTAEQFKSKNSIVAVLEQRGTKMKKNGRTFMALCPFHQDRNPSMSIDPEKGVWNCHAGCGGGDVIRLLAMLRNMSDGEFMKEEGIGVEVEQRPIAKTVDRRVVAYYSYEDENAKQLFEVIRYEPKDFRQRHRTETGDWVWDMQGVRRVLYQLPQVMQSQTVIVSEGEKDAENLTRLGFVGTCNVGGAGKWLDSYSESLAGKDVIIAGDGDKPGQDHAELVTASVASKAKTVRVLRFPANCKDVSDFIATFPSDDAARKGIEALIENAVVLIQGLHIPIRSIPDLEKDYRRHISALEHSQLNLGAWLPTLNKLRGLVAGELCLIMGATGIGKTGVLQNIARHSKPLPTVMFEMELPPELLYERFVGIAAGWSGKVIEDTFKAAVAMGQDFGSEGLAKFDHTYVCTESRLTPEKLEQYILRSELVLGQPAKLILIDYAQLMQGKGSTRYERASFVAEELKVIAKVTKTIIIVASQVARTPQKEDDNPEVTLHDAKESGSWENSAGLVLGIWRDKVDPSLMYLKVLKGTKGGAGILVPCNFNGECMRITERSVTSLV